MSSGPSPADVPHAFPEGFEEPEAELSANSDVDYAGSEVDTIASYPVGIQERLRSRRSQLLMRGVSPSDIETRLAQMAASLGTGVSASSEADRRAAQSLRAQEAYASTVIDSPNCADDKAVIIYLNMHGPSTALAIATGILGQNALKAQVNPLLHRMKHRGVLRQSNNKIWSLADDSIMVRISHLMRNSPPYNAMEIAGLLGVRHSEVATILSEMTLGSYGLNGVCLYGTEHDTPSGRQTYYRSLA